MKRLKTVIAIFHRGKVWNLPDRWIKEIIKRCPAAEVVNVKNRKELEREIVDAEVYFGRAFLGDFIHKARKLRWVHSPAAGVERYPIPELMALNIGFTNSRGLLDEPISDYVIGAILFFARSLHLAYRFQLEGKWGQFDILSREGYFELSGKTLGIVGYGGIGKKVAEKGTCLGMKVITTRRSIKKANHPSEVITIIPKDKLPLLLTKSDFVVLSLPLTPETEGLIGERELSIMKKSAYLINIARGKLIDYAALINFLSRRKIAGAALDVFPEEPLPEKSPLFSLENVLITPHISWISPDYWERAVALFIKNFNRFLNGEPLINLVNKKLGY
jgi:D-2-hydroxyacid dehydrogenase (NADP+)